MDMNFLLPLSLIPLNLGLGPIGFQLQPFIQILALDFDFLG